jgi:hypothetical protein
VGWDTAVMLDYASRFRYLSLHARQVPDRPPAYHFDFLQSSFLSSEEEAALQSLFMDPMIAGDYLAAMTALVEYELERVLLTCEARGERLLIYEDGAYLVPRLHHICRSADHRLPRQVRRAIETGLIAGAVEVTMSGERQDRTAIAANGGHALLPIFSGARWPTGPGCPGTSGGAPARPGPGASR